MKLHLVGLPHTQLTRESSVCAFTQKALKFGKMMSRRGWEIIFYWGDEHETECAELVTLFDRNEQKRWYGSMDANTLPLIAGAWDSRQPQFVTTNMRATKGIAERYEPGDIILLTGGLAQKPITDSLPMPQYLACEWAAGYSGWYLPFVCFESYAWRHHCYGVNGIHDGRWFDTVIPNFFDPEEWSLCPKEDYLVYVGRLIQRKGILVAGEIAREMGKTLVVAGSGAEEWSEGYIRTQDGCVLEGDVIYAGTVGWEERNALMGAAKCLLCPTLYIEPFGAVCVESMLCGTPSVATDWGSFPELLPPERRFRTLAEGCNAVERAMKLKPAKLQSDALSRFSLEAVAPLYERWFAELDTLWRGGWYEPRS